MSNFDYFHDCETEEQIVRRMNELREIFHPFTEASIKNFKEASKQYEKLTKLPVCVIIYD